MFAAPANSSELPVYYVFYNIAARGSQVRLKYQPKFSFCVWLGESDIRSRILPFRFMNEWGIHSWIIIWLVNINKYNIWIFYIHPLSILYNTIGIPLSCWIPQYYIINLPLYFLAIIWVEFSFLYPIWHMLLPPGGTINENVWMTD